MDGYSLGQFATTEDEFYIFKSQTFWPLHVTEF